MPQRIAAELHALASEARRKHPDVRSAADAAVTALREPDALAALRADQRPAAEHTLLSPLLLAFATRTSRVILPALTALHRSIVIKTIPDASIQAVLDALHELIATQRIDVDAQLKILQIASALLTAYASVTAARLSSVLMLCFDLYEHARVTVVTSTAAATLRQNIMTVFDKVVDEDALLASIAGGGEDAAASAPLPVLNANLPDGPTSLFPCAADAYRLLTDLRALANGEAATFLPLTALSRTFVLELLESVLTSHVQLFAGEPEPHPELLYVLRSSICPLLLKSLSDPPAFPAYVRTMRLVLLLLQQFSTELVLEIEVFLRMLLRIIRRDAQEGRPHWHRIIALEAVCMLCTDGRFTRRIWSWFDAHEETADAPAPVFGQMLETLHAVSLEAAPALDRDPELAGALEQEGSAAPTNAHSYSTLYGAAAGVASAAVAGVKSATEGLLSVRAEPLTAASTPSVPLMDQLDKPEAPMLGSPALPHTYFANLAVWSLLLLAQSLARMVLRRSVASSDASRAPCQTQDDAHAAAVGMIRVGTSVIGEDLAFFLTVRCSDYLYDQVLVALANFASAAGRSGLHAERDRLISILTRLALPKGTAAGAPRALAPRSLACAAAICGVAMLLARSLADGWPPVLECLCMVSTQLGGRVEAPPEDPAPFPGPGTASDEMRGATPHLLAPPALSPAALQRRISGVFAVGATLDDKSFNSFCTALARLAESSSAAERVLEVLDGVVDAGATRLAAQRPGGTWESVSERLFAAAANEDLPSERRLHAGRVLSRLFYAALRTGGTELQQRMVFEGVARLAALAHTTSTTAVSIRKSALELTLRILETDVKRVSAWDIVFSICSDATEGPAPLVKAGFACIQLVCTDHLEQLDDDQLRMCVACIPRFSMQSADMNIALAANGMLWEITTEIQRRDEKWRADLWLYVLGKLRTVAHAPHADVRNGAIANLFQLLLQFSTSLGHAEWLRVIDEVLFPLLSSLEEHGTIEWRASRVLAFQGIGRILSELLAPVFLKDTAALTALEQAFFAHVGRAARTAPPDVAQAALDALLATLGSDDDEHAPAFRGWCAAAAAECTSVTEALHSASTLAQALALAQVISRYVKLCPEVLSSEGAARTIGAGTKCLALGLHRADAGTTTQLNKLTSTVYAILDLTDRAGGSRVLVVSNCTDICTAAFEALNDSKSRPVTTLRTQLAVSALEHLDAHLSKWLDPLTLYDLDVVLRVLALLDRRIVLHEGALWERQVRVLCTCAKLGPVVKDPSQLFIARIVTLVEEATANAGSDDAHDAHVLLILATLEMHVLPEARKDDVFERCVAWLIHRTKLYDFSGIKNEKDAEMVRRDGAGTRLPVVVVARERVAYWAWETCIALAICEARSASAPSALFARFLKPRMADILVYYAADYRVRGSSPMPRVRIEEVLYVIAALAHLAEHGIKAPELIAPLFCVATLQAQPGVLTQKATCGTSVAPIGQELLLASIPQAIRDRSCVQHVVRHAPAELAQSVLHMLLSL